MARALDGDYQLTIEKGLPSTYNTPEVTEIIHRVAEEMLGTDGLCPPEPKMAADDFGYMAREAPGVMFNLGGQIGQEYRPHHNPSFDLDESAFPIGAAVLAEAACRLLTLKGQ